MLEEDVTRVSYAQLYRLLNQHGSIIVFLKATDLPSTKRGISNAKTRETTKEQEVGFVDERERINYDELPMTEEDKKKYPAKGIVKLQVSLVQKTNVAVHGIKTLAGDEL